MNCTRLLLLVAKENPPRTVYGIVCGVKSHLADKNGEEALNPLDGHDKRHVVFACLVLFISGIVLVFI